MQVELMHFNFSSYSQMKAASGLLQGTHVENDKGFLKLQVFNSFTSCYKIYYFFFSVTKFTAQTIQNTTSPTTSSNTAAIAGSIIGLSVVFVLSILGVVLWKKYGKKGNAFTTVL